MANGLLIENTRLGNTQIKVTDIKLKKDIVKSEEIKIRTLSPIVAYSTLLRPNGRKYTCYFGPGEKDFEKIITNNLKNKYKAYYEAEPPKGEIKITTKT